MDRNSLIGLVLIGGILIGWLILNGPSKEELRKKQQLQDSLIKAEMLAAQKAGAEFAAKAAKDTVAVKPSEGAQISTLINTDSINKINLQKTWKDFTPAVKGENKEYVLENDKIKVSFLSK